MKQKGDAYFVSLGCPKNLVDTEIIAGNLLLDGWNLTFEPEAADLYIINSCAFIPPARDEAEKEIKLGVKWKKRFGGRLVVAGCLGKYDHEGAFKKKYPEVDLWTIPDDVGGFAQLISGGKGYKSPENYLYDHRTPRVQLTLPATAYLKIADGCDNRCSYCAIPDIRGTLRSRTMDSVIAEAGNLINGGVREIILIAQDVTAFGMGQKDDKEENLTVLLQALEKLEGDFVIRLLYTHPAHYNDGLIDFLAHSKKVLPYLDIPLQHINERILKAMGRKVGKQEIEALLAKMRRKIPDLTLRTTFITGFPGETQEEFEELAEFVREFKFERAGFFAYSAEQNTPAAALPDQVPGDIAEKRARKLRKLQDGIMLEVQQKKIGSTQRVLVEFANGKLASGRGSSDAPEIDLRTVIKSGRKRLRPGDFYMAKIVDADQFQLWGELL